MATNKISLMRIRELENLIACHKQAIEDCQKEKVELEDKILLPKSINKYLYKYFRKTDFFNKKEKMLIHVRKVTSAYEYEGVKIQFHPNGSVQIDPNYKGHIRSIGIEVHQNVWKDELAKANLLLSNISFS